MADKKDISYKGLLSRPLFYLSIVGLNPLAHTKASDMKAALILTLEVLLTFSIVASFCVNLSEPYAIIENFTGFAPAIQVFPHFYSTTQTSNRWIFLDTAPKNHVTCT